MHNGRVEFQGCDYLGLAGDPRVLSAARRMIADEGLSPGASPATTGRREVHAELEATMAARLGAEDALALPSGLAANVAVLDALRPRFHAAWIDERAHPSLSIARRAAELRTEASPTAAGLALVDGVYPARGEEPDFEGLARLLGRGGVLVVDDAHGFGVRGPDGRGSVAAMRPALDAVELVHVVPLTKAIGAGGAIVAGTRTLIDRVRASDAYVGSTALAPVMAAGALAALGVLDEEPERRARLWDHVRRLRACLRDAGLALPALEFPVLALRGTPARSAQDLRDELLRRDLDVPCIRYPDGVAAEGYLRLSLCATHSEEDVTRLGATLAELLP